MKPFLVAMIASIAIGGTASAEEISKFFRSSEGLPCDIVATFPVNASACEFDDERGKQARATGNCQEEVTLYAQPKFGECTNIAFGVIYSDQQLPERRADTDPIMDTVFASFASVKWPTYLDRSWTMRFVPDACRDTLAKVESLGAEGKRLKDFDREAPDWRACRQQTTDAMVAGYRSDSVWLALNDIHRIVSGWRPSEPQVRARLTTLVLAIEDEPVLPISFDRFAELIRKTVEVR